MKLSAKSHIFKPEGKHNWSKSHAQVPLPYLHSEGFIRVFFATRDEESCSSTSFIDVSASNPSDILYVHDRPVLQKGKPGYFDDSGTMPSSIVKHGQTLRLYYTAWNKSKEASYRLSIGVAESHDEGLTFQKLFEGPILDRSVNDQIWVGQPFVMFDQNIWKMWYLSCEKIEYINNHPEPFYNVKYATSDDGLDWTRDNQICIPFDHNNGIDAIGRPYVWIERDKYFMLHSNRAANEYRTNPTKSYQIACSESEDGIKWRSIKLEIEGLDADWCNQMNEYASVVFVNEKPYVFFNGNGFGQSGFGFATT